MIDKRSQILETLDGDIATKIRIHSAFLNYTQLTDYLRVPTQGGLLRIDQLIQTFKTAEKGLRLLNTYDPTDDVVLVDLGAGENTEKICEDFLGKYHDGLLYKIYSANGW
jgi:predicted transcriptional regulator